MKPVISYRQVRVARSWPIILRANIIWTLCISLGLVLAAGDPDPVYVFGMTALSITPLVAAMNLWWASPLLLLAHASVALLVLIAMRNIIWPAQWHEAESSLPLKISTKCFADIVLIAFALLPLAILYTVGTASFLLLSVPKPTTEKSFYLVCLLIASLVLSVTASALVQHRYRLRSYASQVPLNKSNGALSFFQASWYRLLPIAVVISPLLGGIAKLSRRGCLVMLVITVMIAAAANIKPDLGGYWLALFSVLLLSGTRYIRQLLLVELNHLEHCIAPLPIEPSKQIHAKIGVLMSLAFVCTAIFIFSLVGTANLSYWAFVFYVMGCLAASYIQSAIQFRNTDIASASWLVSLVLLITLGSRVFL